MLSVYIWSTLSRSLEEKGGGGAVSVTRGIQAEASDQGGGGSLSQMIMPALGLIVLQDLFCRIFSVTAISSTVTFFFFALCVFIFLRTMIFR